MGGHKTISASSYAIPEEAMFYPRSDVVGNDKTEVDLILDGSYHDWDLSSIIPVGTKGVLLQANIQSNSSSGYFLFKQKGIINGMIVSQTTTSIAGILFREMLIIIPNTNRIIEYMAKNVTWSYVTLFVMGWWK